MSLDIKDIGAKPQEKCQIFPYGKAESLPTYVNEQGERVVIDERWRAVGYEYPYPTVQRVAAINRRVTDVQIRGDEGFDLKRHDPQALMDYLADELILKILYKDPDTGAIEESNLRKDSSLRRWLKEQFEICSFVFEGAYTEYLQEANRAVVAESEEESDFLQKSECSLNRKVPGSA